MKTSKNTIVNAIRNGFIKAGQSFSEDLIKKSAEKIYENHISQFPKKINKGEMIGLVTYYSEYGCQSNLLLGDYGIIADIGDYVQHEDCSLNDIKKYAKQTGESDAEHLGVVFFGIEYDESIAEEIKRITEEDEDNT